MTKTVVELAEGKRNLSRRSFTSVLAGVALPLLTFGVRTVRAQADRWRELRRDDFGFRIEMPSEPETEVVEDNSNTIWKKTFDAQVKFDEAIFGIQYTEYKSALSAEEEFKNFRQELRRGGVPISREIPIEVSGFPAHDFVADSEHSNFIHRLVVVQNRTIAAHVDGPRSIHGSPATIRFLESFTILRGVH